MRDDTPHHVMPGSFVDRYLGGRVPPPPDVLVQVVVAAGRELATPPGWSTTGVVWDAHAPSADAFSVRFSQMSEEAEAEMAEWDALLHPGRQP